MLGGVSELPFLKKILQLWCFFFLQGTAAIVLFRIVFKKKKNQAVGGAHLPLCN